MTHLKTSTIGLLGRQVLKQNTTTKTAAKARHIKLGIDVHKRRYVVVRIIDGGTPQPPQSFTPEDFLAWAQKQQALAEQVFTCYEAGPFGYGLHRRLEKLGNTNYVVRPRDWDEYGQHVKTDNRDAQQLAMHLDQYVAGNRKAFCVVRVPTEAQEHARSRSRQRESLQQERQRLAAQGRSHALYYGHSLGASEWWRPAAWAERSPTLPAILVELLEPLRRLIAALELELKARTKELEAQAPPQLPFGLGKLTFQVLEREVGDWSRFKNRRQVASYTGLCPREDSTGQRRFQGSINKHGNRRLRPVLVECLWRLCRFQPEYRGVKKWLPVLVDPKTSKPRRKKIIVAMSRSFAVDWWRVRTGRCQAEALGLRLTNPSTPPTAPPEA